MSPTTMPATLPSIRPAPPIRASICAPRSYIWTATTTIRRGLSQTIGPVIAVDTVTNAAEFHQGSNPPTVGTEIRVRISLPSDQFSDLSIWKWERSEDGLRDWEDITNYDSGNSSRYTPSGDDEGQYLRVSALYVDSEDERKRALSPTIGPVVR